MLYGMGAGVAREVEATAPQEAPDKCRTSAAEALRLGVITGILVWQGFLRIGEGNSRGFDSRRLHH